MPLPLAPVVAALVGVAFALVGRDEIRRSTAPPSSTRAFLVLVLVSTLLLAPAVGYFLAFHPDWAWSYLVRGTRVPSAIALVAVLAASAFAPLAFAWTTIALRRHAVRQLVRVTSALVVVLAGTIAWLGPRMVVAGTYTAWREGYDLEPIAGTSLGISVLWIDGCLLLGVLFAGARIRASARA